MSQSAIHRIHRVAIVATLAAAVASCGAPPAIEIALERATRDHSFFIAVCSPVRGDCAMPDTSSSGNIFNAGAGDTKRSVAIVVSDPTLTSLRLRFTVDDTCMQSDVAIKKDGALKIKANIDAAGVLTLDCVASGSCTALVPCPIGGA